MDDLPKEPLVETFENVSDINVKNRLTSHVQFWRDIGASPWVMRVIDQSYSLPCIVEPPPAFFMNNQSALKHQAFVANEIQRLLETGCIREFERDEAHIISPLSVAENSETLKLILDLRYLNSFLSVPKFKYEDVRSIRDLFNKGDFFFKFDIKHGYHHVNIDKAYHKYLSFSWSENGITKYYVFTVLVFGLATAPFVFTKVVKVLVGYWRGCGIRILVSLMISLGVHQLFIRQLLLLPKLKKIWSLVGLWPMLKSLSGIHLRQVFRIFGRPEKWLFLSTEV